MSIKGAAVLPNCITLTIALACCPAFSSDRPPNEVGIEGTVRSEEQRIRELVEGLGKAPGEELASSLITLNSRFAALQSRLIEVEASIEDLSKIEESISVEPEMDFDPDFIDQEIVMDSDATKANAFLTLESNARTDYQEAQLTIHNRSGYYPETQSGRKLMATLHSLGGNFAVPESCKPPIETSAAPKITPTHGNVQQEGIQRSRTIEEARAACRKEFIEYAEGQRNRQQSLIANFRAALEAEYSERARITEEIAYIRDALRNADLAIHKELATRGDMVAMMAIMGLILAGMLLIPYLYPREAQQEILASRITSEIVTVFILASVILALGHAQRIESSVLGTLIGGISGYVLGRGARPRFGSQRSGN